MRHRGRAIGVIIAMATVAAVVASAPAYAGPAPANSTAVQQGHGKSLASVLVPLSKQPPSVNTAGPETLVQATAAGEFEPRPGLEFQPTSCFSFVNDVIGSFANYYGYTQSGARKAHPDRDFFRQVVARIPGGADLGRIRTEAEKCAKGKLFDHGKFVGDITWTIEDGPKLHGATSFVIHHSVRYLPLGGLKVTATSIFVASGEIYMHVLDPNAAYAIALAKKMLHRAQPFIHY